MQLAEIGPWEFGIPEGWRHREKEGADSHSYFENPEGDKGLYVKAIELPEPMQSPRELAEYLQQVHQRSFTCIEGRAWEVVDRRDEHDGTVVRSALDLHDTASNYRVLSLVVCDANRAIQVTVHDYWCEDYDATRRQFHHIEQSIAQATSA